MELVAKEIEYMSKEVFDKQLDLYSREMITYETFISNLIGEQKKLIVRKLVGSDYGTNNAVGVEVMIRRMQNAGITISI